MKILITGGAGFIGSHMAETCLLRGDTVYVIDDLSTGAIGNIQHLMDNPRYRDRFFFIHSTILDHDAMLELVGICDQVAHLAAAVGVRYIIENPLTSIITNVRGTEKVLELCDKFKKKVLIASTSEVYGKHDDAPLVETDNCIYGPSEKSRWSYAAGKLMDEFTGLAYHRTKGLPVVIARLFNTVGPRQTGRYGMVIPKFFEQALSGQPITVFGDGTQSRTFTHVREVVDALLALMDAPSAIGQVFNIGGVEEVSIYELAERIRSLTGTTSKIQFVSYDEAYPKDFEDMQRRVPSTEKLRQHVGFAPSMVLDQILMDIFQKQRPTLEDKAEKGLIAGAFLGSTNRESAGIIVPVIE